MNRLSLITHLSDREQMLVQYQQLIQEHLNDQESSIIIALCLNNIGTLLYRNELLSKSVFKFIKLNLFQTLPYSIQYILYINMAKIYLQLGMNGKAFFKAELALQFYEKIAFQSLNQKEAILLINGYIILAKSYELSNFEELSQIRRKSRLLQNGFKSTAVFYENTKKLLVKYVGITHPIYKRFANAATKKSALLQRSFLINNETSFDNFAFKKQTICQIMQLLNLLRSFLPKSSDISAQTPQKCSSRIKTMNEDLLIKNRFYRVKLSSKLEDDQETTVETKKKRKSFKVTSITKLEKIISNKVEQQVQLHFSKKQQEEQLSNSRIDLDQKYQLLSNEINKIEKEKIIQDKLANEWKSQIKLLQDEINQLKSKIVETEQQHLKESKEQQYRHLQQIQHLNEQNQQLKLQMNKTILHEKNYNYTTTNNNSIDDHQYFYFTDSYTGQVISIPLLHNISFIVQQENVLIEIQHLQQQLKISARVNDKTLNEFIEISQLQDFLQYTQYNHTLPYPIKYINNFKTFIQHLLVPFIQIINEQNENRIAIWPYPQGLLQEQGINFLNENCQWWIYNIGLKWFRLTIYLQTEFALQVDIRYDELSFETLFKQENIDEYELQEKEDILQYLNKQNSSHFQLLESSKTSIHSTYYLPNVQIIDKNKLITQMNQLIKQIEQFLFQQGIKKIKSLKIENKNKFQQLQVNFQGNKAQIQSVIVQNEKCLVILKNLYQTYAPNQKQIYAQGQFEIQNSFLKQRYGITFDNLVQQEDKIYFYEKLLESFALQVHNNQLDTEDLDLYRENPIVVRDLNFGGTYKTFYESNNYKIPILFSLIGTNDIPQFVKIDVYNEELVDQHSLLFYVTEEYWIRPVVTQVKDKKKRQQKYIKEFKVSGQYYLAQILQQCGWFILEHHLYINDDKQLFIQKLDSQIGKLEQCINIKSVMELTK